VGLGVGRRLRYLVDRARAFDRKAVWEIATRASQQTRMPRPLIVLDMLWGAAFHEVAFQDYADWDFHLLTRAERRTYMTHPKSDRLVLKVNQAEYRPLFRDKSKFNVRFGKYLGRDWLDIRDATPDELGAFVRKHGDFMAKVPDSLGGYGIEKRSGADVTDFAALHAELTERRQFLVEQVIVQHPVMASLNPSSVNSLRMISYLTDAGVVRILGATLKAGAGGSVDNVSQGGMYTMLDEEGVARHGAFTAESGAIHTVHPITGVSIVGFRVPLFDQVLELVDRLGHEVPQIPYVGWDIAVTPDGPVVIEGNYNSGVFQLKPSVSGVRTGLRPLFKEVTGF
jgi:hypothetical protein